LIPGISCGRYVIKSAVPGTRGRLHLARSRDDDACYVLKEMGRGNAFPQADLAERVFMCERTVEIAARLEHPHLMRVYETFDVGEQHFVAMEYVEGVTVQSIVAMTGSGLREVQVRDWAEQICDALHYLHSQPEPFVFGALDASHVLVTSREQLKLVSYGLGRFFSPLPLAPRLDVAEDYVALGHLLFEMLTNEMFEEARLAVLPTPWRLVIERCLAAPTRPVYQSFLEVKEDLGCGAGPAARPAVVREEARPSAPPAPSPLAAVSRFVQGVLGGLRPRLVDRGVLPVARVHPRKAGERSSYSRESSVAFLVCGENHLSILDAQDGSVQLSRFIEGASIVDLKYVSAGHRLFMADRRKNRLLVWDGWNGMPLAELHLKGEPQSLLSSRDESLLFCVHADGRTVSQIRLGDVREAAGGVLGVVDVDLDSPVSGAVVSADNSKLYLAQRLVDRVIAVDVATRRVVQTFACPGGPGPMTLRHDELWVGCLDADEVVVLDVSGTRQARHVNDRLLRQPLGLLLSPDGRCVYVLSRQSRHMVVLSATSYEIVDQIELGGAEPAHFAFGAEPGSLWVAHANDGEVDLIDATRHRRLRTVTVDSSPVAIDAAC
jgi:hypothetical protein